MVLMAEVLPDDSDINHPASFLFMLADLLDEWAQQSIVGGWSTHQVEANRQTAKLCRRKASLILVGPD